MRVHSFNAVAGTLTLAALVAGAPPSYSDAAYTCAPSISTVFVTPAPSTVTVHDAASTSTVFITSPSTVDFEVSEVPQPTTVTAISTLLSTTTASEAQSISAGGNEKGAVVASDLVTSTLTAYVTVPYVEKSPTTSTEAAVISYYVQDGTTYYLDGQTPSPTESYVYLSSAVTVTVEPINAAQASAEGTTTTVLHTTITEQTTLTQQLSAKATTSASVGTASKFTGIGPDGWNSTSTAHGASGTGAVGTVLSAQSGFGAHSSYSIVTDSTFDIYGQHTIEPLSSLSAAAGFNVYTSAPLDPTVSSTLGVASKTSLSSSHLAAYTTSIPCTTSTGGSVVPPFSNSTTLNPGPTTDGSVVVVPTSSFSTVYTSAPLALNSTTDISSISAKPSISTAPGLPSLSTTAQSSAQVPTSASSTSSSATVASSTTSAAPSQSSCGLIGDFTMNFDDLPPIAIGNQDPATVDPEPLFNPYHQFDWSDGFSVVPPPTDPYLPSSGPLLLEFIPLLNVNGTNDQAAPNTKEFGYSGEFADGDGGFTGCFGFNFYGASLGCDSKGPDCKFSVTGFRREGTTTELTQVAYQLVDVAACPALLECTLSTVALDDSFRNLTAVRMNVTVAGQPKIWWMDDVRLGWFDNSCEKGLCRQTTKVH